MIYCTTQRSGSTLMCDDLFNLAGGKPVNTERLYTEIVRGRPSKPWAIAWEIACGINRVQGVIINKVMFHYTWMIANAIRGIRVERPRPIYKFKPDLFDAFHEFFSQSTWIYGERGDLFAQAVSMYLAEATDFWEIREASIRRPADLAARVPYDRERLLTLARRFLAERTQWQCFFAHYGIVPIRLAYENAVVNYPGYLDNVIAVTGLRRVEPTPPRRMFKVGDARNDDFAERLRADAATDPELRGLFAR